MDSDRNETSWFKRKLHCWRNGHRWRDAYDFIAPFRICDHCGAHR